MILKMTFYVLQCFAAQLINESVPKQKKDQTFTKQVLFPQKPSGILGMGSLGFHTVPELCHVLKCCAEFIGNNYF